MAGGAALSAPLWLPGLAVLRQSSRAAENGTGGLPVHALALLLAQGYDGLPTKGSSWFGPADYYEATGYIGVVALVLALVAVLVAWRRPIVAALTATVLVSLGVIYVPATQRLFTRLGAGSIATQRMLPMLAFAVAMLAGLGTDTLQRRWREPRRPIEGSGQRRRLRCRARLPARLGFGQGAEPGGTFGPPAFTLLASAQLAGDGRSLLPAMGLLAPGRLATGRLDDSRAPESHPGRPCDRRGGVAHIEGPTGATLWTASAGLPAAAGRPVGVPGVGRHRGEQLCRQAVPCYPGGGRLQQLVGNNLLALDGTNKHDVTLWSGVGIYPEVNIGYGIRELAVHDPVIPPAYYRTWPSQAATLNAGLGNNFFAPAVGSATRARYYGAPLSWPPPGASRGARNS